MKGVIYITVAALVFGSIAKSSMDDIRLIMRSHNSTYETMLSIGAPGFPFR